MELNTSANDYFIIIQYATLVRSRPHSCVLLCGCEHTHRAKCDSIKIKLKKIKSLGQRKWDAKMVYAVVFQWMGDEEEATAHICQQDK